MVTLASQMVAFGVMVCSGLVIGCMFDVYRVVRSLIRPRSTGSLLMDLAFWLVVTPAFFLMLVAGNWGELRFYVFLGVALGLFVYFQLASAWVLWGLMSFVSWLGRTLGLFVYNLLKTVRVPVVFWREVRFYLRRFWRRRQRLPLLCPRWGRPWPFFRR